MPKHGAKPKSKTDARGKPEPTHKAKFQKNAKPSKRPYSEAKSGDKREHGKPDWAKPKAAKSGKTKTYANPGGKPKSGKGKAKTGKAGGYGRLKRSTLDRQG